LCETVDEETDWEEDRAEYGAVETCLGVDFLVWVCVYAIPFSHLDDGVCCVAEGYAYDEGDVEKTSWMSALVSVGGRLMQANLQTPSLHPRLSAKVIGITERERIRQTR
jgi:hypothetical protein